MNKKYEIIEKIGEGKFGNVYRGIYKKNGEPVAIKIESSQSQIKLIKNETTILNYLYSNGCRNIPNVLWYGIIDDIKTLCLIMPLYECSLHEYRNLRKFTPEIINSIMIQGIIILESIHQNFIIHRDIKPQNFMIKNGELYLIDFGFATFYVNSEKQHISINYKQESIVGSPKYISIYNHLGISSSRRDDLISFGYILFYWFFPREPSKDLMLHSDKNLEKCDRTHILHPLNQILKEEKLLERIEHLCKLEHPKIYYYLKTCYEIEYHDCPDYEFLKGIFLQ
jgi:serine/threonine protein kinase